MIHLFLYLLFGLITYSFCYINNDRLGHYSYPFESTGMCFLWFVLSPIMTFLWIGLCILNSDLHFNFLFSNPLNNFLDNYKGKQ